MRIIDEIGYIRHTAVVMNLTSSLSVSPDLLNGSRFRSGGINWEELLLLGLVSSNSPD